MKDWKYLAGGAKAPAQAWENRHSAAMKSIRHKEISQPEMEHALVCLVRGWLEYERAYSKSYGGQIGNDYSEVGKGWLNVGGGLMDLITGHLGRLDHATLDSIIRDNLHEQGYDCENEERIPMPIGTARHCLECLSEWYDVNTVAGKCPVCDSTNIKTGKPENGEG